MPRPNKLIIPGFWLKLKVAWWRLARRFKRPAPQIAWTGSMTCSVTSLDGVLRTT